MEGATSKEHARDTVEKVVDVQRAMLSRSLGKPPERIPQVLTIYKEVLDYYNAGLKVPDDVTLVWPEDNYGYLNQLGTAKERARSGESQQQSRTSTHDVSSGHRGGKRSHSGPGGRTKQQLYNEAKRKGIEGRSKMTKAELEKAVGR